MNWLHGFLFCYLDQLASYIMAGQAGQHALSAVNNIAIALWKKLNFHNLENTLASWLVSIH